MFKNVGLNFLNLQTKSHSSRLWVLVLSRQMAATIVVTVCLNSLVQMPHLKTAYFIALYAEFKDRIETFVYEFFAQGTWTFLGGFLFFLYGFCCDHSS